MKYPVTTEQIKQLNSGKAIELMVVIERITKDWIHRIDYDVYDNPTRIIARGHGGAYNGTIKPPVAIDDTVEVVCAACADPANAPTSGVNFSLCACELKTWSATVRSSTYRKTDGVHYWILKVAA